MPPDHHQPPTPVSRAELVAALDASGINIASVPGRARGFGHAVMPPGLGAAPTWCDREPAYHETMRRHLDAINRQLVTTGDAIDHLDATLARAISDHLDGIGLDDLTHNPTHNQKTN